MDDIAYNIDFYILSHKQAALMNSLLIPKVCLLIVLHFLYKNHDNLSSFLIFLCFIYFSMTAKVKTFNNTTLN